MGGINMTNEQLDKGQELSHKIEILEKQLKRWGKAIRITGNEICVTDSDEDKSIVHVNYIDFNVMKTLAIAAIEKELNELKNEFEKL